MGSTTAMTGCTWRVSERRSSTLASCSKVRSPCWSRAARRPRGDRAPARAAGKRPLSGRPAQLSADPGPASSPSCPGTPCGPPPTEPGLFVADRSGAWHFQADLSTLADVDARLEAPRRPRERAREAHVADDVRARQFTGRSDRFFMFEGLGSIFWHMVAKLLLAVQGCHRTRDPLAAELAEHYHDIRDGLGFRRTPAPYGAIPTDPYSHSPRHRGAQQPGMTGQAKEQVLTRFGELGIEVRDGCLHLAAAAPPRSELSAGRPASVLISKDGRRRAPSPSGASRSPTARSRSATGWGSSARSDSSGPTAGSRSWRARSWATRSVRTSLGDGAPTAA